MVDAAAALQRLDAGSLGDIFAGKEGRVEQPTLQCVQIRPMAQPSGGTERWRVVFSDGRNYVQTMLATTLNNMINEGTLRRGFLVQLLGYQANNVKQKK